MSTASDEEAAAWGALAEDDQKSVWNETEEEFWSNFKRQHEEKHYAAEQEYRRAATACKVELGNLTGRRSQLVETQRRLARELAKCETQLARIGEEVEIKADRVMKMAQEYREGMQTRLDASEKVFRAMKRFFRERRHEDPDSSDPADYDLSTVLGPEMTSLREPSINDITEYGAPDQDAASEENPDSDGESMDGVEYQHRPPVYDDEPLALAEEMPPGVVVNVVDADDNVIGPVQRIEPWNQWVEAVLDYPIRRHVKIRRGRKFTEAHLSTIYERSEAKGVKWLSCLIQAAGAVQSKRCQSCEKNQGAFDDCIIIGGALFQKCGNCEWNRQGCHGASGERVRLPKNRKRLPPVVKDTPAQVREYLEPPREPLRELQPAPAEIAEREKRLAAVEQESRPEVVERETRPEILDRSPRTEILDRSPRGEFIDRQPRLEMIERQPRPEIMERQTRVEIINRPTRPESRSAPYQLPPIGSLGEQSTSSPTPKPRPMTFPPLNSPPPTAITLPPLSCLIAPPSHLPNQPLVPVLIHTPSVQQHHHLPIPRSPMQHEIIHPTTEVDNTAKDTPYSSDNRTVQEPEQMPTPQDYRVTPGFTPANSRSRPPSADRPTPTSLPIEPSPQPTEQGTDEGVLEEINRANLILRHNGRVYTYPECVEGIPLEKIDENHPYWEPNWQNVRSLILPQLAKWREKHQAAIDAGPKPERGGSSKYQIGRQVNRGVKILEFLEDGEISPYQLLAKPFIQPGKGGICSYDTLFRLSESISELSKFKLDIAPVEWIRHRLWEILKAEGDAFNLPRTIHDFYHDPKLTALRYKHGFKNIGRPSGMKANRQTYSSPNITPRIIKKRKSTHSMPSTPRDSADHSPLATQLNYGPESPFSTHLQKRPKHLESVTTGIPVHDEFYTADYSDADSWSSAPINKIDFRLYQVKTRLYASSQTVTQYWTWLEQDQCFEHQVLKDVNPVAWALYKDPIDFNINLEEIAQVAWSIEALRVLITMREGSVLGEDGKPRGDVMAAFKRERTMRRFLHFCREMGVKMLKQGADDLERRWRFMESRPIPNEDDGGPKKALLV